MTFVRFFHQYNEWSNHVLDSLYGVKKLSNTGLDNMEWKVNGVEREGDQLRSWGPAFERNPMESSPEDWLEVEWTGGDWQGLEGLCRIIVGSCNMYWRFKPPSVMSAPGPPSLTLKHSLLSGFYITKFSSTCTLLKPEEDCLRIYASPEIDPTGRNQSCTGLKRMPKPLQTSLSIVQ